MWWRLLVSDLTPPHWDELPEDAMLRRSVMASVALGAWMSAALEDSSVCDAMKSDIREWFSAGEPLQTACEVIADKDEEIERLKDILCLADELLMETMGAFPLPNNPLREKMMIIRRVTGDDYNMRTSRAILAGIRTEHPDAA